MKLVEKSRTTSLYLTLLFGPLGLLYSTIGWSIVLTVVTVVTLKTVIGPVICWILAVAIGDRACSKRNQAMHDQKESLAKEY